MFLKISGSGIGIPIGGVFQSPEWGMGFKMSKIYQKKINQILIF